MDKNQKLSRSEYNKQYYQANRENIIKRTAKRQKEYYKKHPEYYNEYSKNYYKNNLEYFKNWHKENKKYIKEYTKNYKRIVRSVNCLPLDNKLIVYDTNLIVEI
jgi:CRISPR/Cas system CMR subunit Cmr6 (Cas7 group RAMP superfamily)